MNAGTLALVFQKLKGAVVTFSPFLLILRFGRYSSPITISVFPDVV